MTYRLVDGDGLMTIYAFAPRVTVSTERDGPTSVQLAFASSPICRDGQEFRVTQVLFERVIEYSWNRFEYHRLISNSDDVEFALIEISDSALISELQTKGRRLPESVRHYRISFDDHGTYDVVCETLRIATGASTDDAKYP